MIFHKEGPTSVGGILVKHADAARSAFHASAHNGLIGKEDET